jgi:uncharacterized membrane protein
MYSNKRERMNLILCVFLGIMFVFASGVLLMKKDAFWSLLAMLIGVYFIISVIGIASQTT